MKSNSIVRSIAFFLLSEFYELKYFMIYRLQSAIWLAYAGFTSLYGLITLTVIYSVSSGIAGWSYFQILALSATATIVLGVLYTVMNPWQMVESMRTGGMDTRLIRPYGVMTLLLSSYGEVTSVGSIVSGAAIFVYAMLHLSVTAVSFIAYMLMTAAGTVALTLFALMLTLLSYHLFKSANFINRVLGILGTAGSYPLSIFGSAMLMVFTVVLPIGIASYYPPEVLFGKISIVPYLGVMALIIAIALVGYKGTEVLIRHYASGGG